MTILHSRRSLRARSSAPLALAAWLACGVSWARAPVARQEATDWAPAAEGLSLEVEAAGELPASITAEPLGGARWRLTFTLASSFRARGVAVAGAFNGWSQTDAPMERGADGRWRVVLEAASGVHGYKFVVDGDRWIADPANDLHAPDGFGGVNSVVRLGTLGRPEELSAARGDGKVAAAVLLHEPGSALYRQRLGDGRVLLRYRTLLGDVEGVQVEFEGASARALTSVARAAPFEFWEAVVPSLDAASRYGFVLSDGDVVRADPRVFRGAPQAGAVLATPDWAKHATWYQLFPERFRNGDPANDPDRTRAWTSHWDVPASWEGEDGQSFWEYYVFQRMYGGDLAGVRERLDHIASLGVTAIYFNPVFAAEGSHKYNATDYRHIDPGLGAGEDLDAVIAKEDLLDPSTWTWSPSDRLFLELLAECKRRGIRVVLDGVFNHVGVGHPAFRDIQQRGADSPFSDWFEILSWEPFRYAGWAGFGELPVFAKDADGLRSDAVEAHVFAVTRRWMDPDGDGDPSDGIDGWRLDVPMEIAMPFWERWRAHVKAINPDAYLAGEVWDRADAWLDGKRFDAVMNYPFADAAVRWVGYERGKISASEIDQRLAMLRLAYPREATYALMNLVDSHDTDRLVSMLANPDRAYDAGNRLQDSTGYDGSKPNALSYRRARLVALLQATYVGAPMIYYGDEVGMWGADDPVNRQPMLWKDLEPYADEGARVDAAHLEHYRAVFGLRRRVPALRLGAFRTLETDDAADLWVFERTLDGVTVTVALNAGDSPAKSETIEALAHTGAEVAHGSLTAEGAVPPVAGCVWISH